jgi:catechol 2,3-dioxygenase-like lactoylglutathione lyase family enzyme
MILEHVAIAVSRLDRSIGFYEALGFRLLRRTQTNAFLYLEDNLVELIQGDLHAAPGPTAADEWRRQRVAGFGLNHLGFRVDRIDPALRELEQRGDVNVVVPPYEFVHELGFVERAQHERLALAASPRAGSKWKLAVVADPDGTLLEIIER